MVRSKSAKVTHKRREKILKHTKGFRWGRKSKTRLAKEALLHAWYYQYISRRLKKRDFRKLWQVKISAATRSLGPSYSNFISLLKKKNIAINRKTLAELAEFYPEIFKKFFEKIKK